MHILVNLLIKTAALMKSGEWEHPKVVKNNITNTRINTTICKLPVNI